LAPNDNDDVSPEDTGGETSSLTKRKGRRAFRKVTRELSDADLANPAVQRLLLDELDRLESVAEDAIEIRKNYHEADKQVAVLQVKQQINLSFEIISSGCLAVGSATLGYARYLWDSPPSGYFALLFGGALIAIGIAAKVVKR
jgi:hypothetical protein